ncbi:AAA family ATPase [Neolewinella aurantiaca]|uniref:AAA family ATPase n=1 Tax=Neolewinella aurantiaca TaxID=2602767 RepID=A0A5C7FC76_9BACT|nr:AAA family ATPase [Neolewinella aurantiaca]TXF88516.1 AAA family ATPase [Neolewinella aurantiaca]
MTIQSLTLENLRGFAGKHEVKFTDPNVAAFIGVNGSGKSTVLEAMLVALHNLLRRSDNRNNAAVYSLTLEDISIGYTSGSVAVQVIVDSATGNNLRIKIPIPSYNAAVEISYSSFNEKEWLRNAIANETSIPIVCAYKAGLPIEMGEGYYDEVQYKLGREQTYFGALDTQIDFTTLTHWLEDLINLQNSEAVNRRDFDYILPEMKAVNIGLAKFWGELEGNGHGTGKVQLVIKTFERTLTYVKNDSVLKFDQLSSGEQLILGLALDVMYRCISANNHLSNPLESPGVVLIDEIELHLHPRWQANIIKALRTTFPNIQFIVSTHSPLVINQLRDEQVFALRKDGIVPGTQMQETYGMDASAVITNIMGAPSRPPEISERFDEVAELLNDPSPENLDKVREQLANLRQTISPNDLELLQFSNILSIEESAVDI